MGDDRLLNWMEVCTLFGCGRSQFYVLVNSGQLPHVRTGKARGIRVLESDLFNFIQRKRTNGMSRKEKIYKKYIIFLDNIHFLYNYAFQEEKWTVPQ